MISANISSLGISPNEWILSVKCLKQKYLSYKGCIWMMESLNILSWGFNSSETCKLSYFYIAALITFKVESVRYLLYNYLIFIIITCIIKSTKNLCKF